MTTRDTRPTGFSMLLLHLHPKMVPEEALAFRRTFGLGGAALVCFVLLACTGALLLFAYEPSPERAYESVRALVDGVPFGRFVRNLHHWAATAFLVISLAHLLRVFFAGALVPPRRANWLVGIGLLVAVVASNFTGYLLPWDQLAYWAVTIATGMLDYVPAIGSTLVRMARGGAEIGSRTLAQFFVLHVAILPLLLLTLMSFHFWLVRKAGGVVVPSRGGAGAPQRQLVPVSPNLLVREGVAALAVLAAIALASAVLDAPLLAKANPGMSPNPAKAPWYFMGLQELLVHLHPAFAVVVVPLAALGALVALPYIAGRETPSGRYFHSAVGARAAALGTAAAVVLAPIAILADERLRLAPAWLPSLPAEIRLGVLPLLAAAGLLAALYLFARARMRASRLESMQAVAAFSFVSLLILTVVGALFRGPGMALVWPRLPGGP